MATSVMGETTPATPVPPAPIPGSSGTGSAWVRRVRLGSDIAAALVFAFLTVEAFLFVHHFAVNAIFADQWTDIALIRHADQGTFSFLTMWAQHNENRILFPNLVVLVLSATTHFNVGVEDLVSTFLWWATTAALIVAHKLRSRSTPWIFYCPPAALLLLFYPLTDALFGAQIGWFFTLAGLAGALFFLDRPMLSRWMMVAAIGAGMVGSFSAIEGLFIWPAGLVLLLLRRRTLALVTAWVISGVVAGILYFVDFDFASSGGNLSYVFHHPTASIEYFFSSIGNIAGTTFANRPDAFNDGVLTLGILVFAIAAWAVVRTVRRRPSDGSPIGVALITFGLVFEVFSTLGRLQLGLVSAGRFSIFTFMIWFGVYLALLPPFRPAELGAPGVMSVLSRMALVPGPPRPEVDPTGSSESATPTASYPWDALISLGAIAVFVLLMVSQALQGTQAGLDNARAWRSQLLGVADVTANIDKAPDSLVQSQLGPYPIPYMRSLAAFSRSHRLSLFDTGLAAADGRQGIFPNLVTSVILPRSGAVVSGPSLLDARVGDARGMRELQFRVTGGTLHDATVGTGRQTFYGWVALWDTARVRNGAYQLRSVVVGARGTVVRSDPIVVVVQNGPAGSGRRPVSSG